MNFIKFLEIRSFNKQLDIVNIVNTLVSTNLIIAQCLEIVLA